MARPRGSIGGVSWPKLYFDMEPDEEEVRHDILLLKKKMGDWTLPLQHSKQIIIGDVTQAFLKERDPITGIPWAELSDRAKRVPRFGKLRRLQTGARMYRALTNRFNYGVTKDGVYLNQSRMPRSEDGVQYFPLHQQDEEAQSRNIVKIMPQQLAKAAKIEFVLLANRGVHKGKPNRAALLKQDAYEAAAEKLKAQIEGAGASAGKIPQRRMIGPSPEARVKIEDVFDDWAKDVITIYKRGRNVIVSTRPGMTRGVK